MEAGPRRERIAAARAQVAEAEARLRAADAEIDNLALRSAFDGVVTVRHREPGEVVAAGAPVVTVMNPDDRWVRIFVREDRIGAVHLGQPATITADTYPDRTYPGEVVFIASEAEFTPKSVQTSEERVKLVYALKVRITGDPSRDLKPGVPADVRLDLSAAEDAASKTSSEAPRRRRHRHAMSSAAGDRPATARRRARPFALIELTGLVRRFRDLVAVDGLSFAVEEGELFGLVGPDGAGKTTTLRMLAGVLRPTAGDVRIGGVSVVRDPERVKPGIAYMSQRFGLYADLTVDENLTFYADLYGVPRREREGRLERLFAFSGLGPFRDRLAGQLSGGMKQKLGLSCALVHRPQSCFSTSPPSASIRSRGATSGSSCTRWSPKA